MDVKWNRKCVRRMAVEMGPIFHKWQLEVVSGTAKGADQMGEFWAEEHGVLVTTFPADWDRFGRSAGYRRNEDMAKYSDVLVAFWDGHSRGTKHMIDLALEHSLEVHVFRYVTLS